MSNTTLLTFASWEDRFPLGVERICSENRPQSVVVYYTSESANQTRLNRRNVESLCREREIPHRELALLFDDPTSTWKRLRAELSVSTPFFEKVLVDISTMPRDVIWTILLFLRETGVQIEYSYCKPAKYDGIWLSRDPARPRLVYKLAGISEFDRPTILLITTGFDVDRTQMLVNRFEPRHTLLAVQEGGQFNNASLNTETHKERFPDGEFSTLFEVNAYSADHGLAHILEKIQPYLRNSNIVASSLGPKPSAVALFKLASAYPSIALAYAPAKEYNPHYSKGIGECVRGSLTAMSNTENI